MTEGAPSIAEAMAKYIATLSAEERADEQPELNRFIWWFGGDRRTDELSTVVVEGYQTQVQESGASLNKRLGPIKTFLAFAYKQGYLPYNMAKYINLRRSTAKKATSKARTVIKTVKTVEEPTTVQLTAEGHAKMKAEYEHLTTTVRAQIAHDLLEARRDKDIRENAGYDAAKQQQGLVEARIRELEAILGRAEIVENGQNGNRISIGTTCVLCDMEDGAELKYMLVSPNEVNPREGKISTASPVGKALLDHKEGDVVEVQVPAGVMKYKVVKLEH